MRCFLTYLRFSPFQSSTPCRSVRGGVSTVQRQAEVVGGGGGGGGGGGDGGGDRAVWDTRIDVTFL